MALVIANTYKSDAKPPGTSKIYYGPEMTFGAKSVTVVKHRWVIYYRKFTMATGNLLVPGGTWKFPKYFQLKKKQSGMP